MAIHHDARHVEETIRIELIGRYAMTGHETSFLVDDDHEADRYIALLHDRFPQVQILRRRPGPRFGETITVCVDVGREGCE